MCGIAGIVNLNKGPVDNELLLRMSRSLSHRGPDDEQFCVFDTQNAECSLYRRSQQPSLEGQVGFAHRRLSIIDLSSDAAQPMSDEDGRIWIIYHGEIFNYLELKGELSKQGHIFRTRSDTEVI